MNACKPVTRAWSKSLLAVPILAAAAAIAALQSAVAPPGSAAPPAAGEAKARAVLEDLYQNQRQGMMNVPPRDGEFLRLLAAASRATRALEIGASNGYSGIWISLGLAENGGKLTTLEIDAKRAALARENFKRAGVDGAVRLIEGDALKELGRLEGPFDFIFIDAWKGDYARYLEMVYPKLVPGGIIAAHNVVSHAKDMGEFLEKLKTYPELETSFIFETGPGISVSYRKKPWPKAE